MKCRGVMIAGLGMSARELPAIDGFQRLMNPGVGGVADFNHDYSVMDVASFHAKQIESIEKHDPFVAIGMSMGGMVLSVLATKYRHLFPEETKFLYLVTSANSGSLPAVPDALMKDWFTAKPGNVRDFERIMSPFFSRTFLAKNPARAAEYFSYRALGHSGQTPKSFVKQLNALRGFLGEDYFSKVQAHESIFIGGADDRILGPAHNRILKNLAQDATHHEVADLGHMINIERPDLISDWAKV